MNDVPPSTHASSASTHDSDTSTTRVPVIAEQAHVAKRRVQSGQVRVRTVVDEHQQVLREQLVSEALEVTNVPVEREVEAPPPPRQEGDLTIVSLVEERLVVVRKLFVVEELHIRRTSHLDEVSVPVTLRAMRAVVEEDDRSLDAAPAMHHRSP